jgi:hypothetical protein
MQCCVCVCVCRTSLKRLTPQCSTTATKALRSAAAVPSFSQALTSLRAISGSMAS